LLGGEIGPAISGLIAETWGWRCILYMSAGVSILCEILFFMLLRETYKVPILKRRAAKLRKEKNDDSLKCAFEAQSSNGPVGWAALRVSITRPVIILWDSSVLKIMSFYGGLVFTFYYVVATTLPEILREIYHFNPTFIGFSFMSFSKFPFYILLSTSH
jgi:MFS family permease